MLTSSSDKKKPHTRSLAFVFLAWVFIGAQGLLAAGNVYNYNCASKVAAADSTTVPLALMGQGATKMRLVATQARPDIIGNVAVFLAVVNALGLVALMCGLLSWTRSGHKSGKMAIAAAIAVILINSILNLPYA
jgi:hypothetical protein